MKLTITNYHIYSEISQTTNAKYLQIYYTDSEYKIPRMLYIFYLAHKWCCEVN
jgi:hypothetical protein